MAVKGPISPREPRPDGQVVSMLSIMAREKKFMVKGMMTIFILIIRELKLESTVNFFIRRKEARASFFLI